MEILKQYQNPSPTLQIQPPKQDDYNADYSTNFDQFLNKYSVPINEPVNFQPFADAKPSRSYKSKPKKKYFPKKYRASFKKLKKPKINPIDEVDDFSMDSLKNKRRIPVSFSGPSQQLNNPFEPELSSLKVIK